jgi:transcription elongation GreA/GreB family factor
MVLDKKALVAQLEQRLQESAAIAQRAEEEAREAARSMATESEKKEDGRTVIEWGSLATGQAARTRKMREDLKQLSDFCARGIPDYGPKSPIGLGAVVDVQIEGEEGCEERTFILLPVGAGTELTGPGGEGFLSVITPASPVGRALLGKHVGDTVEVIVRGEAREWTVTAVA